MPRNAGNEYQGRYILEMISSMILHQTRPSMSTASQDKNRGSLYSSFAEFFTGMSPVATEERRMLPLGGGLKRSASFVISVDEVEVLSRAIFISMVLHPSVATLMVYFTSSSPFNGDTILWFLASPDALEVIVVSD